MVSHRRKRPHSDQQQQQKQQQSSPSSPSSAIFFACSSPQSLPRSSISRPASAAISSLATRQILPQTAPCRQRYNAAFQALQNAYKQAMLQKQRAAEGGIKIEAEAAIDEPKIVELKRNMANCRERQRTEELNEAFKRLRRAVPSMPSDKMSKIHTLRIATEYIRFLDQPQQACQMFDCSAMAILCASGNSTANQYLSTATAGFSSAPQQSFLSIGCVQQLRSNFNEWRSEMAALSICAAAAASNGSGQSQNQNQQQQQQRQQLVVDAIGEEEIRESGLGSRKLDGSELF